MKPFSFLDPKFYGSTHTVIDPYLKVQAELDAQFKAKQLAVDNLTRDQLVEAVVQAIKAGDFTKLVVASTDNQQILYLPYQGVEELREQLADTKEKLEKIKKILYPDENPN